MPITSNQNQTNKNNNQAEKELANEPKIPQEGLLSAKKNISENDPEASIKKWRRIILNAIKPQEEPLKPQEDNKNKKNPPLKTSQKTSSQTTKDTSPSPQEPNFLASKRFYLRVIFYLVFVFVIFVSLFGYTVYRYGWYTPLAKNQPTNFYKKILFTFSYPAAAIQTSCGWRIVSYAEFYEDSEAVMHFHKEKQSQNKEYIIPSNEQILTDVTDKELKNKLMECLAQERGIEITDQDINFEMEKTIAQAGDQQTLEQVVKDLYDWDLKTFKNKVLHPYLLENTLTVVINTDQEINIESYKKAQEILEMVKENPNNFNKIAREYSEDQDTKNRNGDLNWIEKGQIDIDLEEAAFNLEIGQTSEIIQSLAGYHIIKVTDKKTTDGVDQVRLSHILIKTRDFTNWLDEEFRNSQVYKLY
ncbi:peptidylprolyl isomerase [Candidatus Falkowbacteria bacterium]|nr:peptidylprolyl isomerase [Candidatus Falkowbacteria bacterium]